MVKFLCANTSHLFASTSRKFLNCTLKKTLSMNKHSGEKSYPRARQLLECGLRKGRAFQPEVSFLGKQQEKKQKFPVRTPASLLSWFPAGLTCMRFFDVCSAAWASWWFCSRLHWQWKWYQIQRSIQHPESSCSQVVPFLLPPEASLHEATLTV